MTTTTGKMSSAKNGQKGDFLDPGIERILWHLEDDTKKAVIDDLLFDYDIDELLDARDNLFMSALRDSRANKDGVPRQQTNPLKINVCRPIAVPWKMIKRRSANLAADDVCDLYLFKYDDEREFPTKILKRQTLKGTPYDPSENNVLDVIHEHDEGTIHGESTTNITDPSYTAVTESADLNIENITESSTTSQTHDLPPDGSTHSSIASPTGTGRRHTECALPVILAVDTPTPVHAPGHITNLSEDSIQMTPDSFHEIPPVSGAKTLPPESPIGGSTHTPPITTPPSEEAICDVAVHTHETSNANPSQSNLIPGQQPATNPGQPPGNLATPNMQNSVLAGGGSTSTANAPLVNNIPSDQSAASNDHATNSETNTATAHVLQPATRVDTSNTVCLDLSQESFLREIHEIEQKALSSSPLPHLPSRTNKSTSTVTTMATQTEPNVINDPPVRKSEFVAQMDCVDRSLTDHERRMRAAEVLREREGRRVDKMDAELYTLYMELSESHEGLIKDFNDMKKVISDLIMLTPNYEKMVGGQSNAGSAVDQARSVETLPHVYPSSVSNPQSVDMHLNPPARNNSRQYTVPNTPEISQSCIMPPTSSQCGEYPSATPVTQLADMYPNPPVRNNISQPSMSSAPGVPHPSSSLTTPISYDLSAGKPAQVPQRGALPKSSAQTRTNTTPSITQSSTTVSLIATQHKGAASPVTQANNPTATRRGPLRQVSQGTQNSSNSMSDLDLTAKDQNDPRALNDRKKSESVYESFLKQAKKVMPAAKGKRPNPQTPNPTNDWNSQARRGRVTPDRSLAGPKPIELSNMFAALDCDSDDTNSGENENRTKQTSGANINNKAITAPPVPDFPPLPKHDNPMKPPAGRARASTPQARNRAPDQSWAEDDETIQVFLDGIDSSNKTDSSGSASNPIVMPTDNHSDTNMVSMNTNKSYSAASVGYKGGSQSAQSARNVPSAAQSTGGARTKTYNPMNNANVTPKRIVTRNGWGTEKVPETRKRKRAKSSPNAALTICGGQSKTHRDIFVRGLRNDIYVDADEMEDCIQDYCEERGVGVFFIKIMQKQVDDGLSNVKITVAACDYPVVTDNSFWPSSVTVRDWRVGPSKKQDQTHAQ